MKTIRMHETMKIAKTGCKGIVEYIWIRKKKAIIILELVK